MPSLRWAPDRDRRQEILPARPWGSNCLPPLSLQHLPSDCGFTDPCDPGSLTEVSLSASACPRPSPTLSLLHTHTRILLLLFPWSP